MKYFSVIASILLLGAFLSFCPSSATAANAESETTVTFSGWGDEDSREGLQADNRQDTGGEAVLSTIKKLIPKTGERINSNMILFGLLLILGLFLFVLRKRRKEEDSES